MKTHIQKFHKFMERFIQGFNFIFFIVTLIIWVALTIKNIATQPFQLPLLWDAFNEMYNQLSFKIGCIFLIIFNGFTTVRGFILSYMDIAENVKHSSKLKKLLTKKRQNSQDSNPS